MSRKITVGDSSEEELLMNLGGARFLESEYKDEPSVFEAIGVDRLGELLDGRDEDNAQHVLGTDGRSIREELEKRYSAPDGASRVMYVVDFCHSVRKRETSYYNRSYDVRTDQAIKKGWLVLPRPLFLSIADVEELQSISDIHGPVLIPDELLHNLFGDITGANAHEFTVVAFDKLRLVQVNHNEMAFKLREYNEARKTWVKRTQGSFPQKLIFSLVDDVNPNSWPESHPYKRIVRGMDMNERCGWYTKPIKDFRASDITMFLEINRKLDKRPWWRESSRYSVGFREHLIEALQYIHSVEDKLAVSGDTDGREFHLCKVCNWLRREARAMKIKMPRPAVKPLTPTQQAQRRKRGKKKARQQRKMQTVA